MRRESIVKKKYVIISIIIALAILSAILVSRLLAVEAGNKLITPEKTELHMVSCRPFILQFKEGRPIASITGIGWRVAYNTDRCFIIGDVEVYTSLTGKIIATNPIDLKSRVKAGVKACS
jgi:hypothetical protein